MKNHSTSNGSGVKKEKGILAVLREQAIKAFQIKIKLTRNKKTIRHAGQRRGGGNSR